MNDDLLIKINTLYEETYNIFDMGKMLDAKRNNEKYEIEMSKEYVESFDHIVNLISLKLISKSDNFYGSFFQRCLRKIRFDIETPTAINFKNGHFIMYFNPMLFLQLNVEQMQSSICHEVLHIISLHIIRKDDLRKKSISSLACNIAMDMVVNQYLDNIPPYAITIQSINVKYDLELEPYSTLEYYASAIQNKLDLLDEDTHGAEDDSKGELSEAEKSDDINNKDDVDMDINFNIENAHDIWEENDIDDKTLDDFIKKYVQNSLKGNTPSNIQGLFEDLQLEDDKISWEAYLKNLIGKLVSGKRKTSTRRDRRQPNRLDIRGQLNRYKPEIIVAFDISGSISDEEFKQASKEVLSLVKNYNNKITVIECDDMIRSVYSVKSEHDIRGRSVIGGGTMFSPVFEYANRKKCDLLIYFTDGVGENNLISIPQGYNVLWILCSDDKLSLSKSYGAVKRIKRIEAKDKYLEIKDLKTDGYSMNNQQPII